MGVFAITITIVYKNWFSIVDNEYYNEPEKLKKFYLQLCPKNIKKRFLMFLIFFAFMQQWWEKG